MTEKIGLVVSGGGNRSGGAVGALHAFFEEHDATDLHVLVVVSGGVEASIRSLTRRFKKMYEWPYRFANRRYVFVWRFWRMMDIDVLVDDIMGPEESGHYEEASRCATRIWIPATHARTGDVRWFTNEDLAKYGNKIKKATCAVPGIYGKEIVIDGVPLIDGCFSVSLADAVKKAFEEGADKVIVIDTEHQGARWRTKYLVKALAWRQGKAVRSIVSSFFERKEEIIKSSECVFVCRPHPLAIRHALDTNSARLAEGIRQGYAAMIMLLSELK